jgi:hypothetical protein
MGSLAPDLALPAGVEEDLPPWAEWTAPVRIRTPRLRVVGTEGERPGAREKGLQNIAGQLSLYSESVLMKNLEEAQELEFHWFLRISSILPPILVVKPGRSSPPILRRGFVVAGTPGEPSAAYPSSGARPETWPLGGERPRWPRGRITFDRDELPVC